MKEQTLLLHTVTERLPWGRGWNPKNHNKKTCDGNTAVLTPLSNVAETLLRYCELVFQTSQNRRLSQTCDLKHFSWTWREVTWWTSTSNSKRIKQCVECPSSSKWSKEQTLLKYFIKGWDGNTSKQQLYCMWLHFKNIAFVMEMHLRMGWNRHL